MCFLHDAPWLHLHLGIPNQNNPLPEDAVVCRLDQIVHAQVLLTATK